MHKGRVVFGAMDEVVFGRPAAEAVAAQMDRLGATRAFLMVAARSTETPTKSRKSAKRLGSRCAATFDAMPPHTPREAVIAAAEQARAANADLIVTVGGGSITDGAKAVQLCLANDIRSVEGIDAIRAVKGAAPAMNAPSVRQISVPTTIAGGEFSAMAGVTNPAHQGQGNAAAPAGDPARRHPRSRHHRAHAGMAVSVDRHPRRRSLRRRPVLARGASLCRCAGAEGTCRC